MESQNTDHRHGRTDSEIRRYNHEEKRSSRSTFQTTALCILLSYAIEHY
ncbi:MAG: hypothetical protein NT023_05805 [Armatimonadetes bacterium]|nr:hypothetical protein [Armatimonadota bacterium]